MPETTTVLVCAANPRQTDVLEADREIRALKNAREQSQYREVFQIEIALALEWDDLRRELIKHAPVIVHFIGHGDSQTEGLVLSQSGGNQQLVSGDRLAKLFNEFPSVICVVLNACRTREQAECINRHVPFVVGMTQSIGDEAGRQFATAFYDGVFAGYSFSKAFNLGLTGIISPLNAVQPVLLSPPSDSDLALRGALPAMEGPTARQPVNTQLEVPQAISSSSEQKVLEALWNLDCADQQFHFDRLWPTAERTSLITIQASGIQAQQWLVKRFARQLPRFSQARPFPIDVRPHPMTWDFQEFWNELARPFPEIQAEPEAVLQRLCECYQAQSVVIAMYGLANAKRFKEQHQQVINDFWIPLCERIEALPSRSRQSRLVMFCTGEPDQTSALQGPSAGNGLLLPVLKAIDARDVEDWLYRDPVYDQLCERRPDIEEVITVHLPNWDTTPDSVLNEIRYLFGDLDLKSHWELAG